MNVVAFVVSALLLVVAAALRAAGASLVRTPRADALHDAADGDERAERVAELLEDRARLQPALGMVHSGMLVATALPVTWAMSTVLSGWTLFVALVLLGLMLVLVGDVIPRSWGRNRPRRIAYRLVGLLEVAAGLGRRAADLIEEDQEMEEEANEDEEELGERELISSVLEFSDTLVREVMVPRTDMVTVSGTASSEEALGTAIAHGYSRIPVAGDGPDHILGIVYAKDLLNIMNRREAPKPVIDIMRPAYFVPETKKVAELLREMQVKKVHMAVVVDEFGGTAGLCTIEDLLEELVGEIVDEYDTEEPMAVPLQDGSFLVDARMPVEDLSELIGIELPDEDWDTVGGLVFGLAGRVPKEGEIFEIVGARLEPARMQGRRVARVHVTRV